MVSDNDSLWSKQVTVVAGLQVEMQVRVNWGLNYRDLHICFFILYNLLQRINGWVIVHRMLFQSAMISEMANMTCLMYMHIFIQRIYGKNYRNKGAVYRQGYMTWETSCCMKQSQWIMASNKNNMCNLTINDVGRGYTFYYCWMPHTCVYDSVWIMWWLSHHCQHSCNNYWASTTL